MKKIAKILFWSVLFVWMIFLQPQNVMAAEADEIIKELDFTDINAQTQDLPEKMDFEKMVNKLVTEGTNGLDAGMICEYIACFGMSEGMMNAGFYTAVVIIHTSM